MSKYSINNLDDDYVKYLYKKIPILQEKNKEGKDGVELLQLVLDYIEITEKENPNSTSSFRQPKNQYIKNNILQNINNSIKYIVKHIKNVNVFHNKKEYFEKKNEYVKRYNIKAIALIEGIILVTLNYYQKNNTEKNFPNTKIEITNSKENNNTKKINIEMEKVTGKNLGEYILELYKTNKNELIIENKIFTILKKIAEKLRYLQNKCLFIHGDFHSGNIFIKEKNNNDYNIKFIDVEYSTIKLPTKNIDEIIILTSPVDVNISRKTILNIDEEPELKALDLFHLIVNIKSFINDNNVNKKIIERIYLLITKLNKLYDPKNFNNLSKQKKYSKETIHFFTRKINFFDDNYLRLIPENFIKINNIDSINNLKLNNLKIQSPKRKLENVNIYSSPIKTLKSTPPSTPS